MFFSLLLLQCGCTLRVSCSPLHGKCCALQASWN
jgi:hypothetical protein